MVCFETLNKAQLEAVTKNQLKQQREWRSISARGIEVECGGEMLLVLPNVFPPRGDTQLLIDNLEIKAGSTVLDMGTGTGALVISAVRLGACSAIAVDLNPDAVRNAGLNVERCGFQNQIDVRLSDGFASIDRSEKFDLIIANLPGRSAAARDVVEAAQWDSGFQTHKSFFSQAPAHLKPSGRILMTKANYPEINDVVSLAHEAGLSVSVMAAKQQKEPDPRTYYVLEFKTR